MPWLRTNHTVAMGTEMGSMTPIPTEVALDEQTVASRVTWGGNVTVGASVFRAVLPIMTIVKTLKTVSGQGCRR